MKGDDGEKPLRPCLGAVTGCGWLSTEYLAPVESQSDGSFFLFFWYTSAVMFLRESDKVEEKHPYAHGQTNTDTSTH